MLRPIPVALLGLILAATVAKGDEPPATSYDIVYAKAGGVDLRLDLARPASGSGPFPAVVVIHGGGWRGGSKGSNRALLAEFAKRGYVAISPQYRFCPKETFPAQVHDVKAAVRWLRSRKDEYKVDADHVGAVGFSAGGHLSLMLGVTGPEDGLEGDAPAGSPGTRVQAVVNYFGPADLGAADIPDASKPLVKDFVGNAPDAMAKASPITYIGPGDAPILTFQGTKDPLVPFSQAERLTEAMAKAGVAGRTELLLGAGHGWSGKDLDHTMEGTYAFFDRYLKPAARPK